jgi:hypothetical protein
MLIRVIENPNHAWMYIVTAKHIIDKARDNGATVLFRMTLRAGGTAWFETILSDWRYHPDDSDVDVAVYHGDLSHETDRLAWPITACATAEIMATEGIGLGDEVFLVGLFKYHYGTEKNIPIVRIGHIAAIPDEKIETSFGLLDAYLIEARSISGLSGSPVFVRKSPVIRDKGLHFSTRMWLLGLIHGHWNASKSNIDGGTSDVETSDQINAGIAIVIPVDRILEVIAQPAIRELEVQIEAEWRTGTLPVMDSGS